MRNNGLKSTFVTLLILAVAACNNTAPNNYLAGSTENFSNLDREYVFSTKELTRSYLERKLLTWLGPPLKGPQLVKEIAFAMFKYAALFRDLMQNNNNDLLNRINAVQEVIDRRLADPPFAAFLDSCNVTPAFTGEFQVNSYTSGVQNSSSVAMDSDGDFVVTWQSYHDIDGSGIYARRFNSAGTPAGSEFLVNTFSTNNQYLPSAAMNSDGNFVITWVSYHNGEEAWDVYARLFDAAGQPAGPEFLVNTYTSFIQYYPAVAMDSDGDFVIAWQSYFQDGSRYGVYAQRYFSDGSVNGGEFKVNSFTTEHQGLPAVAMDAAGDFAITWIGYGDGDSNGIYARLYDRNGITVGTEFRVNTFTENNQEDPVIAMDYDGDFVITWRTYLDTSYYDDIHARRYNSAGLPVSSEFRVNTYTTYYQEDPAIAMDAAGDFVISWDSYGQDGSYYGIYAQRYDSAGLPVGTEFRVNSTTTSWETGSATAIDSDGDFVITWTGYYQDDPYSAGIIGQRYNSLGVPR
jgi:hypothetical protein